MRVRYECRKCHWKNETLPDDDPSFQAIPRYSEEVDYQEPYRQSSAGTIYCSVISYPASIGSNSSYSSAKRHEDQQQEKEKDLYRKHTAAYI
jgi:hypothetical protein